MKNIIWWDAGNSAHCQGDHVSFVITVLFRFEKAMFYDRSVQNLVNKQLQSNRSQINIVSYLATLFTKCHHCVNITITCISQLLSSLSDRFKIRLYGIYDVKKWWKRIVCENSKVIKLTVMFTLIISLQPSLLV